MSGTRKSTTQHKFSEIPRADIPRSKFDRSHGLKTTFDAGQLVPVFMQEALPGDTFNCRMTTFARMGTQVVPILDNLHLDSFFFSVPLRVIWSNFQRFMGQEDNPGDSTDYDIPQVTSPGGGFAEGTLYDYFGLPTLEGPITVSAMYGRAYNQIYTDWFRSEDLQDRPVTNKLDGPDTESWYRILKRGKRHDYFTSCLPWPQKGAAVTLPLGTAAPIVPDSIGYPEFSTDQIESLRLRSDVSVSNFLALESVPEDQATLMTWGDETGLEVDLSMATSATINQLRQAFQLQRLFERDARGGTRYTEIIKSHFNVSSPDHRLQRPEFLGGGSQKVTVTPVPNTSDTAGSDHGDLAAYAVSSGNNHSFVHSFTEHCIVIGLVCLRADLNYQQGIHKQFRRIDKHDFFWPALQNLGEQAVLNEEIYADGTSNDADVFGYQERWAEYRYQGGIITGKMRSNATGSLDQYHLAQDFDSLPVLDDEFIQEDPPVARILAAPTEPDMLFDAYFNFTCARPMPTYSIPGMIDHF